MTRRERAPSPGPRPRPDARPTGGFLLRFAAVWVGALVVFSLVPAVEDWFVAATIANVRWLGALAGQPSDVQGDVVRFRDALPASIASDCTTLMPTALLWSGIVAFPAAPAWKLVGMAAGALVLWVYNLARILTMIAILKWDRRVVDFIHVYVWQTVTIAIACMLFLLWTRKSPARSRPA